MTSMYLNAYIESKQTVLEYVRKKKIEEDKANPFKESYSYTEEHPKLTPNEKTTDDLFEFYKGKSI